MTGKIRRLIQDKGYGFVTDEVGLDRFLHAKDLVDSSLWPSLREGQLVEFEPVERTPMNTKAGGRHGQGMAMVKPLKGAGHAGANT